jgi:hypothetical protein
MIESYEERIRRERATDARRLRIMGWISLVGVLLPIGWQICVYFDVHLPLVSPSGLIECQSFDSCWEKAVRKR